MEISSLGITYGKTKIQGSKAFEDEFGETVLEYKHRNHQEHCLSER
jgi:hypothetical protein